METVAVLVMGTALGSVLGYWSVLLRVWRLEKELAQAVGRASVLELVLESRTGLDSEWVWVQKSEWESVKVKQSELEMALDSAQARLMVRE